MAARPHLSRLIFLYSHAIYIPQAKTGPRPHRLQRIQCRTVLELFTDCPGVCYTASVAILPKNDVIFIVWIRIWDLVMRIRFMFVSKEKFKRARKCFRFFSTSTSYEGTKKPHIFGKLKVSNNNFTDNFWSMRGIFPDLHSAALGEKVICVLWENYSPD